MTISLSVTIPPLIIGIVVNQSVTWVFNKVKIILNLPKSIEELEKNMRELKAKRNDVQRRVKTEEEIRGHQRYDEVQLWLQDVESVEKKVDDFFRKKDAELRKALVYGNIATYLFAKRVLKMVKEVSDLKSRGSFIVVAGPAT